MQILINHAEAGLCVREWIKKNLSLSVKMLKYLKYQNRGICVNGEACTVRRVLREGDVLTLLLEDRDSSPAILPVPLDLEILYEDDDVVLPNKPGNMPTHPSHGHRDDTVANALSHRYTTRGIPFVFRPINRLDRNTSGVLLIARNKHAAGKLAYSMQSGEIRKTYLAVLQGELENTEGVVDAPLHRTAESIIVREVCSPDAPDADAARTEYRVLCVKNGYTLVEAHPITGRTHQLRVHFAHLGYPIVGDDLYGSASPHLARHALHAQKLCFVHPTSGKELCIRAPLPQDMLDLIKLVFGKEDPLCNLLQ